MNRVAVRVWVGLLVLAVFILGQAMAANAATINNGGFETGNFAGWSVSNQALGSGSWFVYAGTVSPLQLFTIPGPSAGTFAATTDQSGPGSHVLYRDVALEPAATHILTFTLGYENDAVGFATPASLNFTGFANQQYRVDIMRTGAPVTSVAASDVLARVFRTEIGGPATMAPSVMSFNLTPFAGQTVRIRFAEVDNQTFFRAQLDAVRIASTPIQTTTTTTTATMTNTTTPFVQDVRTAPVPELARTGEETAIPLGSAASLLIVVLTARRLRRRRVM